MIDDFGYRQHNEEQIIALSPNITIAVLPHAPNAVKMANLAHNHGNDILIHLPMAPISRQPLEVNTLFPWMSEDQIDKIISEAVERVPYAVGVNNHMGSLMTADLTAMSYVMKALSRYDLFFLDSKTVGGTKAKQAAEMYHIPLVTRDVFLDNLQIESEINHQFDLAINLARKKGYAIAIGHPHSATIQTLKKRLANLPDDIELIKVQQLIQPKVEQ
ncbi:divergent polysaccharide deacetylase family protein [Orbaceae bacterium ESL0721]|nr:divergent polysaccharide deacetylase family protein [Orbaceae bacterium ESL0721]